MAEIENPQDDDEQGQSTDEDWDENEPTPHEGEEGQEASLAGGASALWRGDRI